MKHLQTSHSRSLRLHIELKAKAVEDSEVPSDQSTIHSDQGTIAVAGMKKTRTHFMKQDEILTCIVKYLCVRGGLPLNTVYVFFIVVLACMLIFLFKIHESI